jgi:hypothetical protein
MAGKYNISVNQGSTFRLAAVYKDSLGDAIDLTGYEGRGQIKFKATDTAPIAEFNVTVPTPLEGSVLIELDADALANVQLKGESYSQKTTAVYDIELYSGDEVIRLLNGTVSISPEVTK